MRYSIFVLAAAVVLAANGAHAVNIDRFQIRGAVEVCQGSLPNFEGALRKRPLAIANEGSTRSFLTCSLEANDLAGFGRAMVRAIFVNRGAASSTVACTLVDGLLNRTGPAFFTKSADVPAGGEAVISWGVADQPGGFAFPNLNCSLPPGVEIGWIGDWYPEDIGA